MSDFDEQIAGPPERRQGIVEIQGRRFRVREPAPRRAFGVIAQVTTLLGPMLTKILSGQLTVYEAPVCPVCKAEGQAETVNGRWSCVVEVAPGEHCPGVWDKQPITGDDGKPRQVGLSYVLGERDLRAAFAAVAGQRVSDLDPAEIIDLAERALPGCSDVMIGTSWVEMRTPESLDRFLPNGMAIAHLLRGALEAWILPSLVDDWTDTTPASSTKSATTTGGNGLRTTDGVSTPDHPVNPPSGTRAPPPVRRHG